MSMRAFWHAGRDLTLPSIFPAQQLLTKLLASLGPIATQVMIGYLQNSARVLLADVNLLEMIATLLPNLSRRIIITLVEEINASMRGLRDTGERWCQAKPD